VDSFKTELIVGRVRRAHAQVEQATTRWVAWLDTERLRSSMRMRPPAEIESL
jgi:hypothetical protein